MTRKLITTSICAVLLLIGTTAHAFVGSIAVGLSQTEEFGKIKKPFAAKVEVETSEGKFRSSMQFDNSDGNEKLVDVITMGGNEMRTLTLFSENRVLVFLQPDLYVENEIGESERSPEYEVVEFTIVERGVMVNDQLTDKVKTVHKDKDGTFGGFLWINRNNVAVKGFMVSKSGDDEDRILFNVKEYEEGPQPKEAFMISKNAKPFTMPDFGGMAGMPGAGGPPGAQQMPTNQNQSMPDFSNMTQMQQVDDYSTSSSGVASGGASGAGTMDVANEAAIVESAMDDAAGTTIDPTEIPGEDGELTDQAKKAAQQGVQEGVVEGTKNAAKGLIDKGFGLFKKK